MEDILLISEEVRDIMERLMCTDIEARLGSGGSEEVKNHKWLADVKWNSLWQEPAPFIPVSKNVEDTGYFDDRGAAFKHELDFEKFPDDQSSDFGESVYKNLLVLERENQKIASKIKQDYPLGEEWLQKRRESMPSVVGPLFPTASHACKISHARHNSASATMHKSSSNCQDIKLLKSVRSRSINASERPPSADSVLLYNKKIEVSDGSIPTLLIADDNPITSEMLENYLVDKFHIVTVQDGAEAVQSSMSMTKYALIFVSHDLPIRNLITKSY